MEGDTALQRATRSITMFRYRTLEAAKRNAAKNGYRGAMYPWEADDLGNETTPHFAHQNALYEIHINGDVALAQWQYFLATRDSAWLARHGYPVIRATADFWVSRATHDRARDRYEIRDLVSVAEHLIGVHNEAYTNAVAKRNLEIAVEASRRLGREPDPRWAGIAARMYIPYDSAGEYHPTYESAPPALMDEIVPGTYRPWLRAPFNALSETPRTDAVHFITGAGGFLQHVLFGYTGLRLEEDGWVEKFDPLLPSSIERSEIGNAAVAGTRYDIVVRRGRLQRSPTR